MRLVNLPEVFAQPRRHALILVMALSVLQGFCLLVAVYATRGLFSGLHEGNNINWQLFALLSLTGCLVPVLHAMARIRAEALSQSYAVDLRETTLDAIARLPAQTRAARSLGGMSLRFVGDMSAARQWVGLGLTQLVSGAILLPVAVACLWYLHPSLALAGLGLLLPAVVAMLLLGKGLQKQQRTLRQKRAKIAIRAMNRLGIISDLFNHGRLVREKKQLRKQGEAVSCEAVARVSRVHLLRTLPEIALGLGGALILLQTYRHGIPASSAAAALAVLAIVGRPLRQMAGVWDKYTAWNVARSRYLALFEQATVEPPRKRTRKAASAKLKYRNNAWSAAPGSINSYNAFNVDDQAALRNTLAGETNHEGWTSDIVADNGRVPRVLLVSDDPVTLPGTLRRALSLGCAKRPDDKSILLSAEQLGLTNMLDRLGGLDGKVKDNATDLPPSDRLRISICQALLARPSIIVIHSHVWQQLPDAASLLTTLREQGATIMHNLPATVAPGSVIWRNETAHQSSKNARTQECA